MTTGNLKPLSSIFKGDCDSTSPRKLTDKARQAVDQVDQSIQHQKLQCVDYEKPWVDYTLPTKYTLTVFIWQKGPLLWINLPIFSLKVLNPHYKAVVGLIKKIEWSLADKSGKNLP